MQEKAPGSGSILKYEKEEGKINGGTNLLALRHYRA